MQLRIAHLKANLDTGIYSSGVRDAIIYIENGIHEAPYLQRRSHMSSFTTRREGGSTFPGGR